MDELEKFRKEAEFRKFSPRTIESYENCLKRFFNYVGKDYRKITKKDIREFLEYIKEKGVAGGTIHIYLNAIKFFFEQVMRRNIRIDIKYSKRPSHLPEVLTKEEIKRLIFAVKNHKHKVMIALLYSAGLRVSELVNLKVKDFNFREKYGFVRQGKGRKDRIFIISEKLERVLFQISLGKNKEDYIFTNNSGNKYSTRTIAEIINKSALVSGISKYKKIHPHTLRHSFATHLIQNGNSVNEVQALLGHKSPETTMIYVHLASSNMINIKSPLDSL